MYLKATALHVAAASGKAEAAVFLIEKGAEIAKPDGCGFTPLHYAQVLKKQDTLKALRLRLLKQTAFTDKQVRIAFYVVKRQYFIHFASSKWYTFCMSTVLQRVKCVIF